MFKIFGILCFFLSVTTPAIAAVNRCVCGFTATKDPNSTICKGGVGADSSEWCDRVCKTIALVAIEGKVFKATNHFYEGYGDPINQCKTWCEKDGKKCANKSWDVEAIKNEKIF